MVEPTDGRTDVYTVDTELLGSPGLMAAYVVDAERPAVVDPGAATATGPVLDALDELDIDPESVAYLIPTHVHLDHAGAAGSLADACPNATVLVHERGVPYLIDPEKLDALFESAKRAVGEVAAAYGEPDPVPPERCETLGDGDVVDLGDRSLEAIDAPGHAPHQHALLGDDGTLFAGDAAGAWLGGQLFPTTPGPDFDLEDAVDTAERLRDRDPDAVLYGHFGAREDAIDALNEYAAILPEFVDAVDELREEHGDPDDVVSNLPSRWASSPTIAGDVRGVLRYLQS
ncbi:MBL fold metallo-hydrolase [Halostella sp. JP-L12]|uniref:MBL fold metallo-hydrolase n=1 Tax=Halostella TaxID=1843185 RepID=UPI000EF7C717|nr:MULTISPECIES: MBL fold metallo-hydrolase [Halostella]NHN48315.1 MBL fold metallo-hydrolase [Halostella sp. JP-L12]